MSKLTAAARDQDCIRCGRPGETRACHYNGWRSHAFGKGRGIKCDDLATAEFCQACDLLFSESSYHLWEGGSKSVDRSEQFLFWITISNIRRKRNGVIA